MRPLYRRLHADAAVRVVSDQPQTADALLDRATASTDNDRRRALFAEVQRIVAAEVPYISLWHLRNVIVAQRTLTGLRLSPIADFSFLRDVARCRD